ncbi:hypothetical protein PFICI_00575 [Pestalotiopsis fici W106-1]|uniref:Uncharacterized protein n=1 Tax=Pestalotiopsis fici (strain W106-1 / CGMCC3.15140) TaxID=1229662 RepID=W3XMM5_PESFW|nr:uncharacterized protein PFICI_00575 [Pestalotiopsis fici W106-1]ETS86747.1 hypothetical protein PFICI_00575 [Pestalotiopsis fici W106-1]
MAGNSAPGNVQETPVPVPKPQILQAQSQIHQPNPTAPSVPTVAGAPASTAVDNKGHVAAGSTAQSASMTQPPNLAGQAQVNPQPISRSASVPAVQTPVPAPVPPLMAPAPATGVPAPALASASAATPATTTPAVQAASSASPSSGPSKVTLSTSSAPSNTTAITSTPPRPSSPEIPVVEPLTPPLAPVQFPPPRQSHTYLNHPAEQTVIQPPAPAPLDFDSNPDVLALKSTMAILQIQAAKAKRDMVALQKAKEAALADPEAFMKDLQEGKIQMGGSGLSASLEHDDDSDSDSSGDDDEDVAMDLTKDEQASDAVKSEPKAPGSEKKPKPQRKPWSQLPNKQSVARMPAINWSQYAVVGESLDRLHNDQVARPAQGTPATLAADGTYVFHGEGRQQEFNGIAAPFDPLKDQLAKKSKPKTPNRQG